MHAHPGVSRWPAIALAVFALGCSPDETAEPADPLPGEELEPEPEPAPEPEADPMSRLDWQTTPVRTLLRALGDPDPTHATPLTAEAYTDDMVRRGEELVLYGQTADGESVVAKTMVCTDCHNLEREDPDLRISDAEARYAWTRDRMTVYDPDKPLPITAGSTLFGIVDREAFYNGFYQDEKYGVFVTTPLFLGMAATESLQSSVVICGQYCSAGYAPSDAQVDDIVAYLWTLQFTLGDLDVSAEDRAFIEDESQPAEARIARLKSYYLQGYPATLGNRPADAERGFVPGDEIAETPDPERGRDVFERACLGCHDSSDGSGPNDIDFTTEASRAVLSLYFTEMGGEHVEPDQANLYYFLRHGEETPPGEPYAPAFLAERVSDQMLEDMRAYVDGIAAQR